MRTKQDKLGMRESQLDELVGKIGAQASNRHAFHADSVKALKDYALALGPGESRNWTSPRSAFPLDSTSTIAALIRALEFLPVSLN